MSKLPDSFSKLPGPVHQSDATVVKRVRSRTEDSAFLYAILEANEGITAFLTLPCEPGSNYRDLELHIPVAFVDDVGQVLESLSDCLLPLDQLDTI